jgi:hypothetical protein
MNDTELSTMVRESVAGIRSATPVAQIISRGRAVRARRRVPGLAGVLTLAAGIALAVTTLLPSGHPAQLSSGHPGLAGAGHPGSRPARVRLAAWTVAEQPNGDIDVTISQLKDPAGLQAALRADGVPVNVSFSGSLALSASCQSYQAGTLNTLSDVTQIHGDELVIDPSALPRGTGLAIFDEPGAGQPVLSGTTPTLGGTPSARPSLPPLLTALNGPLAVGLVYASPQCTG